MFTKGFFNPYKNKHLSVYTYIHIYIISKLFEEEKDFYFTGTVKILMIILTIKIPMCYCIHTHTRAHTHTSRHNRNAGSFCILRMCSIYMVFNILAVRQNIFKISQCEGKVVCSLGDSRSI